MRRTLLLRAGVLRAALGVAIVWIALSGCTPRDPLDRQIEAGTLAELRDWLAEVQEQVDPGLAREIDRCIVNLANETPRYRRPASERELHQRGNPLCVRVNGRTLRAVMIESYTTMNTSLSNQNNIDAQNLVRLSGVVSTDRAEAFEARVEAFKRQMAVRDEQIRLNNERIAQLRGPAS